MNSAPTKLFVLQDAPTHPSLIIAGTIKNTGKTGVIKQVGADIDEVHVGERIMFDRYTTHPNLPDLIIVDFENVIGTVK